MGYSLLGQIAPQLSKTTWSPIDVERYMRQAVEANDVEALSMLTKNVLTKHATKIPDVLAFWHTALSVCVVAAYAGRSPAGRGGHGP